MIYSSPSLFFVACNVLHIFLIMLARWHKFLHTRTHIERVTYFTDVIFSINNKLQQPEAAAGVLDYAMKHHSQDLVSSDLLVSKICPENCDLLIKGKPQQS